MKYQLTYMKWTGQTGWMLISKIIEVENEEFTISIPDLVDANTVTLKPID